ncbi:MAG: M20 family metallo-hydrolase [Desulfarculus sp.]|nr:M20 family metallo-hydrolase [Desulfarculus sp.]
MGKARQLLNKVAELAPEMVELMRIVTAVPALGPANGGQGELAKLQALLPHLEALGLTMERVDAPDPRVESGLRPNLLAWLPGGDGPTTWVLSHLDVVPPGDLSAWGGDPWSLRVRDGRLYGRGVEDNHHGLVSSYFALKAMKELGITPPGPAGMVLVADEETGSGHGLEHVLKTRPDAFSPADLIVVPDGGDQSGGLIEVTEKSIYWLKVEVNGRQTHGASPHQGVNALMAAARMMTATREVLAGFPQTDQRFGLPHSTMEPTRIEEGVANVNTIPGRAVFYLDCRLLPEIPLDEVAAALRQSFEAIASQEGATVAISEVQRLQSPPATPSDAPVVRALQAAIRRVHGVEARPGGIGGGTVAAFFRQRGLPAAVWSKTNPSLHQPEEWVELETVVKDAQVMALLYAGLWEQD